MHREPFVVDCDVRSELLSAIFGAPQGSMMGSKSFIIFMNDLVDSARNLNTVLLADDTNLYLRTTVQSGLYTEQAQY